MTFSDLFENAWVISLQNDDRLPRFYRQETQFPFVNRIKVFNAIDGNNVEVPDWWAAGPAAYGCFRSHTELWKQALDDGAETLTVFEDDACFRVFFEDVVSEALGKLPDNWDMLYLGGQQVSDYRSLSRSLAKIKNVNRLHGYVINGSALDKIYHEIVEFRYWRSWHFPGDVQSHIDHQLGRLQENGLINAYSVRPWVCYQGKGYSNIMGREEAERSWDY